VNPVEIIAALTRPDFLAELHHLLWTEPFSNRGVWDEGWNCRDHAVVVGFLMAMSGHFPYLLGGKCMFVQGPSDGRPPVGFQQSPHVWLGSNLGGCFDLSVRLTGVRHPKFNFPDWPVQAIAGSKCVPTDTIGFSHTALPEKYEKLTAAAGHVQGVQMAVYLRQAEPLAFTRELLRTASDFSNSPLTDRLRDQCGPCPGWHARAAMHLHDFLNGRTASLAKLAQGKAWEAVAQKYPEALETISAHAGLT
jgi:hypothetical protein